jgi:hypothetical protein
MAYKLVYNIEPASPSMISSLDRHCLVREPDGSSNIDNKRSHLNRVLQGLEHEHDRESENYGGGLGRTLKALYASGVKKPAAQSERPYLRIVLSASPEYFRPSDPVAVGTWDEDRLAAWKEATMKQLKAEHGADLIFAELHLDEDTPHIHAVVAPTYLKKARVPGKQKRGETPEQFEERKALARTSEGIRTVGRASHPTLSKQGSFQRLRERMTVAVDHLGIEYGEDRAIDAPEGQSTREWVIQQAAEIREREAKLEQERKALDQQHDQLDQRREAEIAEAIERNRMVERTAELAETARNQLMDTAKQKAAEAEKRAVEAEERLQVAHEELEATKTAQRGAQEAADAIESRAHQEAANIILRARESAEADVRAITHSMLKDDGKAFVELKEENQMLRKQVQRWSDFVDSVRGTLSAALGDRWETLRQKINDAWKRDPKNPDYQPEPPSASYSSGPSGP